jgi:hypothetical protein
VYVLQNRALTTGRVVPVSLIQESLEQVPRSVKVLAPLVDYHAELHNFPDSDIELVKKGETWDDFRSHWIQ